MFDLGMYKRKQKRNSSAHAHYATVRILEASKVWNSGANRLPFYTTQSQLWFWPFFRFFINYSELVKFQSSKGKNLNQKFGSNTLVQHCSSAEAKKSRTFSQKGKGFFGHRLTRARRKLRKIFVQHLNTQLLQKTLKHKATPPWEAHYKLLGRIRFSFFHRILDCQKGSLRENLAWRARKKPQNFFF